MTAGREREVIDAFVGLTASLTDHFDVVEMLTELTSSCARLLGVASVGLLLADADGDLQLLSASSQSARDLELFQLQRAEGPCLDCFRSGTPVNVADLGDQYARWPQFAVAARTAGVSSVHAVPLRLRDTVLGALNLFGNAAGPLDSDDLALAQALAHVASVALVQHRAAADKDLIVEQLNTALSSRVVLEQARGVIAQRGSLDMDDAFAALRAYARDHNLRLSDVASGVVVRRLAAGLVLDHWRGRPGGRRSASHRA